MLSVLSVTPVVPSVALLLMVNSVRGARRVRGARGARGTRGGFNARGFSSFRGRCVFVVDTNNVSLSRFTIELGAKQKIQCYTHLLVKRTLPTLFRGRVAVRHMFSFRGCCFPSHGLT